MKVLTKGDIEQMAMEVVGYCHVMGYKDVFLYYNGKRLDVCTMEIEDKADPHDFIKYCPYNHTFSMVVDDPEYDLQEDIFYEMGITNIFKRYGLYADMCDSWNCSCYPIDDDLEIEYTIYDD